MTGFSQSPRLKKGALVVLLDPSSISQVILFQYNPESLTRTLRANYQQTGDGGSSTGEPLGLKGPPSEAIQLEVELDAADQLERNLPSAVAVGIYPALAALEALLFPSAAKVIADEVLLNAGILEVVPPKMPLVLFAWGPKRVLPVRLSGLSITEQAFDPELNPILAKVSLSLDVLTYQDLGGIQTVGGALYMAHHIAVETLSRVFSADSGANAAASTIAAGIAGSRG